MKLNSFSVIDKIDHRTNVWVENADKRSLNFSFWLKRKKPKQYDSCKRSYFYFYSISLKDLLITDYIFIAYTPAFKELRIIVFSVVNMTEKLKCCQLDLGQFFLAWLIWRNHNEIFFSFFLCNYFQQEEIVLVKITCWKSYYRIVRTDIWD